MMHSKLSGDITTKSPSGTPCIICDVHYFPDAPHNLLSVSQICDKNLHVLFTANGVHIARPEHSQVPQTQHQILTGKRYGGIYQMDLLACPDTNKSTGYALYTRSIPLSIWHRHFNHLNIASVKQVQSMVDGMKISTSNVVDCISCIEGKSRCLPFPSGEAHKAT